MKYLHRIVCFFALASFVTFGNAFTSEAQIFNKISKGLDKVNKGLEKVNKEIENVGKATKGKENKSVAKNSSGSVAAQPVSGQPVTTAQGNVEELDFNVSGQDGSIDFTTLGAVIPHVTADTKILYKAPQLNLRDVRTVGEGIFITVENNKLGFWTMDGRCLTDCRFDMPYSEDVFPRFDNGAAIVKENGNYVILYTDGTARRLSKLYNSASQFHDGVAVVKEGIGKYCCIDTKGNKIWPQLSQPACRAEKVGPIRDGLRCVKANVEVSKGNIKSKWGFIDRNGNWAIKPVYDDARDFKNGYCLVEEGSLMKFIDTKGNTVYQFDDYSYTVNAMNSIGDIYNGYFLYAPLMGRPQFYDLKGNLVKGYQDASGFTDKGYAFVRDEVDDRPVLVVINSDFEPVRCLGFLDVGGYWVTLQSPTFGKAGLGTIVNHLVVDEEGNVRIYIPILPETREMWNCNIGDFVDDYAPCKILRDPWDGPLYGYNGFVNTKGEFEVVICDGERNLSMLPGDKVDGVYKVSLTPFDTTPIGPKYIN